MGFPTQHLYKDFKQSSKAAGLVVETTVEQEHQKIQNAHADHANLTGAGEFAARGSINVTGAKLEAEKKKKDAEKALLQSALEQQIIDLRNDINDLIDQRNALVKQKANISDALKALDNGALPEDVAQNPKMESLVKKYEKIHGKKPSNDDPTSFYTFLQGEGARTQVAIKGIDKDLKAKLGQLKELDPTNDNVQKVGSILNDLEKEEADIISYRLESKEMRQDAFVVNGVNESVAEDLASLKEITKMKQSLSSGSFAKTLDGDQNTSPFKDEFQRVATAEIADTISPETKNVPVPDFSM